MVLVTGLFPSPSAPLLGVFFPTWGKGVESRRIPAAIPRHSSFCFGI